MGIISIENKSNFIKAISLITLVIGLFVISSWLFNIPSNFNIIPGVPPMDLTTAFSFFLLCIGVLASQRKSYPFYILNRVTIISIFIISIITISQYLFGFNFSMDTSFSNDTYALKVPRGMPLATAICFFLLSISTWGMHSTSKKTITIGQYVYFTIILINFSAVIAYILNIPAYLLNTSGNDASFIILIPIHTSLILFWFAAILSLKNATKPYNELLFGSYSGSKVLRSSGPFAFTMIMVLGLLLLYFINSNKVNVNVGLIIYSVIAGIFSTRDIFAAAIKLNTAEHERNKFENAYSVSTKEMNQYKEALDTSSLVDITDAEGRIISVNNKFCEISNYDRNELIGKKHNINNSGHHSKEFFSELWTTIKRGDIWVGGIKNKTKNGMFYWVHTAIIPFKNEIGEIYQFLTIRQDITKHTLLSLQYENLKLKNKEIEQFTYIASHDLQEPLRTVSSMIDILKEQYSSKLDEDANFALNFMTEATDRMSELIKGLLDYSRIGGGKQLVSFDSCETIHCITEDLATIITRKNAEIKLDRLPIIKAYRTEIRLLFQNLISNAIKFHKEGVTPKIHISVQEDTDYWKFSVKDNGIGISEKDNRNVFAIFQRLNKRNAYEGTGIGLAHCEKIVHLHGGEIWVDSKLNKGSTFYFTIPKNLN